MVLEYVGIGLLIAAFLSDLVRVGLLVRRLWKDDGTPMDTSSDDFADLIATIARLALMIVMIPLAFVAIRLIGVIADLLGSVFRTAAVRKLLEELFTALDARRVQALGRIDGLTDELAQAQTDALVTRLKATLRTNDAPDEFVDGIGKARITKQGQGIPADASFTIELQIRLPTGEPHTLTLAGDADGNLVLWMCSGCGTVLRALRDAREAAALGDDAKLGAALDTLNTRVGDLQSNTHVKPDELVAAIEEVGARIVKLRADHGTSSDGFFAALSSDAVVLAIVNAETWTKWLKGLIETVIPEDDEAAFKAFSEAFGDIGYSLKPNKAGQIGIRFRPDNANARAPKLTWDHEKRMVVPDPMGRHGASTRLSDGSHLEKWELFNRGTWADWFAARGRPFPPARHQGHHIVPDAVVREHPAYVRGRVLFAYDLDHASNVDMLPIDEDAAIPRFSGYLPYHRGSHPKWNAHAYEVTTRLMKMKAEQRHIDLSLPLADIAAKLDRADLEWVATQAETLLRADLKKQKHRYPAGHEQEGKLQ